MVLVDERRENGQPVSCMALKDSTDPIAFAPRYACFAATVAAERAVATTERGTVSGSYE
jgi:hypothetical protein